MIPPGSRSPPRSTELARAAQPLAEPRRSTAALPTGGQLHLHFHGLDAGDVAANLNRQNDP